MASGWFELDVSGLDQIQQAMEDFGKGSGQIINDVLHGEGANEIKEHIARILPSSGRTWRTKKRSASTAMPGAFKQDDGALSVTIAARGTYHYLYFPDDGSDTKHHAGNQQFMRRGAEDAANKVIDLCVGKLIENF